MSDSSNCSCAVICIDKKMRVMEQRIDLQKVVSSQLKHTKVHEGGGVEAPTADKDYRTVF